MAWQIKGSAAVTPATFTGGVVHGLNATGRSFEALNITAASLQFQSLAMDSLRWTATTTTARGGGTIVPVIGQMVEIFSDGVRKFRGHAVAPKQSMTGLAVEVVGPWWWMQEITLTGTATSEAGDVEERTQFQFAAGDLRANIGALISQMITLGVPITYTGACAAMGPMSQITLNNMSCANALVALLSRCPDAVAYFDYTGTLPELRIGRRNGSTPMADLGFTVGTDPVTLEGDGLRPRLDLKVSWVSVHSMGRHATTKAKRYLKQISSGTRTAGEWVIHVVSGPEIVQALPPETIETYNLQTSGLTNALITKRSPNLAAIVTQYGSVPGQDAANFTYWNGSSSAKIAQVIAFPGYTLLRDDGVFLTSGFPIVTSPGTPPEWVQPGTNRANVTVSGTWLATATGTWSAAFSALWNASSPAFRGNGYLNGVNGDLTTVYFVTVPYSFPAIVMTTAQNTLKALYKEPDYTFPTPPAGMADFLRESQNWVPWEGSFVMVGDDVSGTNFLGRSINLAGTHKDCANMRATLKSLEYDLMRKRSTWTLGAPARIDYKTAVGRTQTSPADNIINL